MVYRGDLWCLRGLIDAYDGDREGWRKMLPGQSDISPGRLYRESLRTAKADPDRNEPYVLRGKRV